MVASTAGEHLPCALPVCCISHRWQPNWDPKLADAVPKHTDALNPHAKPFIGRFIPPWGHLPFQRCSCKLNNSHALLNHAGNLAVLMGPHLASPQCCGISVQARSICIHTATECPQAPYTMASDCTSGSPLTNVDASLMHPQQGHEKCQHCDSVGSAAPPEANEGMAEGGRQVNCDSGWRCCRAGNKCKCKGACGRGWCVRCHHCFC